ncbi:MAG: phosphosulfolactate synthase [Nitrospirae bacterium]|nr:phosphosulfolactate synthase [Nitrospirota bacterium]
MPLKLPVRVQKLRKYGLTAIMDLGLPLGYLESYLKDYNQLIDIAKFGIGSALVVPHLHEKVKLYKDFGVNVCFGGTLFEKFFYQSSIDSYCDYLSFCGVDWIEVSAGTINIDIERRVEIIESILKKYKHFTVVGEVGSKSSKEADTMTDKQWINEIKRLQGAGCSYVIIEARATGMGGIFREDGTLRADIFDAIVESCNHRDLIIEAPTHQNQAYFINRFGANVNLGNIVPDDIIVVESLRQGLRSETFFNTME